jgi:hypothetical protein
VPLDWTPRELLRFANPANIKIASFKAWHEGPAEAGMVRNLRVWVSALRGILHAMPFTPKGRMGKVSRGSWRHSATLHYGQIGSGAPGTPRTTTDMPAIGEAHKMTPTSDVCESGCALRTTHLATNKNRRQATLLC